MLSLVIQHQPDRTLPNLGRKLVRCLACHGSTFSRVGASDKPGAVQTAPRSANLISSTEYRRSRLAANLKEQRDIALADAEGREYTVTRKRWEVTDTGEKKRVDAQKRLKRWWTVDTDGKLVLTVRWDSKPLELQGDKTAIAVGDKSKLVGVLEKLVQAVHSGELDAAIAKAHTARVSKRKAAG
jgi:hypothetical protein